METTLESVSSALDASEDTEMLSNEERAPMEALQPREMQLNDELPSIEEVIQDAAIKAETQNETSAPSKSANRLFSGRMQELGALAGLIGSFASLSGPGGLYGFTNPAIDLKQKVESGALDDMPMDDYTQVLAAVDNMAALWEGQEHMSAIQLARNAIICAVMDDCDLWSIVFDRACEFIEKNNNVLKLYGCSLTQS